MRKKTIAICTGVLMLTIMGITVSLYSYMPKPEDNNNASAGTEETLEVLVYDMTLEKYQSKNVTYYVEPEEAEIELSTTSEILEIQNERIIAIESGEATVTLNAKYGSQQTTKEIKVTVNPVVEELEAKVLKNGKEVSTLKKGETVEGIKDEYTLVITANSELKSPEIVSDDIEIISNPVVSRNKITIQFYQITDKLEITLLESGKEFNLIIPVTIEEYVKYIGGQLERTTLYLIPEGKEAEANADGYFNTSLVISDVPFKIYIEDLSILTYYDNKVIALKPGKTTIEFWATDYSGYKEKIEVEVKEIEIVGYETEEGSALTLKEDEIYTLKEITFLPIYHSVEAKLEYIVEGNITLNDKTITATLEGIGLVKVYLNDMLIHYIEITIEKEYFISIESANLIDNKIVTTNNIAKIFVNIVDKANNNYPCQDLSIVTEGDLKVESRLGVYIIEKTSDKGGRIILSSKEFKTQLVIDVV